MRYSKYGARKCVFDGITFDSAKECRRYKELKFLEEKGLIKNLRRQVEYELIPNLYEETEEVYSKGAHKGEHKKKLVERKCSYRADFVYDQDGETIVEDVKGLRMKEYIIKRKLMLWVHGIRIKEV